MSVKNPILPGFHPDPAICRAEEWFYVATSTFEWFPGVRLHRSRDLVHWELVGDALTRVSQLDLRGVSDSSGVWAPCLSYHDGLFYLIYTNVFHRSRRYMDSKNYLVTAEDPAGPWSEPTFLVGGGFDPSLFHDEDGRKWLVWTHWDPRPREDRPDKPRLFGGIHLQEYDPGEKRLVGAPRIIFKGSKLGATEGPHLYRHDGRYYLMCAEGGTGYAHAVTLARADKIEGPYEIDPQNPMLTVADKPGVLLQKAGHASIVELDDGSVWLAHLCSRPQGEDRRCMLGRETALQACEWNAEGWLRIRGGGNGPKDEWPAPDLPEHPADSPPERIAFDGDSLHPVLNTLRIPATEDWLSLSARPGWLRLWALGSPCSVMEQSVVARRLTSHKCEAACRIEFDPADISQTAGLMATYNTETFFYLALSRNDEGGREVRVQGCDKGRMLSGEQAPAAALPEDCTSLYLRFSIADAVLRFFWSLDGKQWNAIGPDYDATKLSDDYAIGFTGAFAALGAHDPVGRRPVADFEWFEVKNS